MFTEPARHQSRYFGSAERNPLSNSVRFLVHPAAAGVSVPRAHLHVVRRDNPNGALAKSRRQLVVPLDFLVVQALDSYQFERAAVPGAGGQRACEPPRGGGALARLQWSVEVDDWFVFSTEHFEPGSPMASIPP